jgi:hypothetical protein
MKFSSIKFHGTPSSESRAECADGQTDRQTGAFRDCVNAPQVARNAMCEGSQQSIKSRTVTVECLVLLSNTVQESKVKVTL